MPVIPQYNAAGPASPRGPVLNRERTARLDNSAALQGLGQLAQSIGSQSVPLPNIDPETGQNAARAVQGVGQQFKNLGNVIFEIREREAEARNYRDVHEAKIAMEREAGEFEKWKESHPNPQEWEPAWQERASQFADRYFEGRELAPAAQEQIMLQMESFNNRQAIQVGVSAVKETTRQAREALEADIVRAGDAEDFQTVQELARYGEQQGWFPADYAARLEVSAIDNAEAKALERASMRIETDLLNGDIDAVREGIRALDIPPEEKRFKLAEFENRHAENIVTEEINNQIFEDPGAAIERLESEQDSELGAAQREALKQRAYEIHHEDRLDVLSGTIGAIDSGGIKTVEQLTESLAGETVSEAEMAMLEARLAGNLVENAKQARELQTKASGYDPSTDPYGVTAAAIRDEVLLSMPEGERKNKIMQELERRAGGDPITMTEAAKSKAEKRYYDQLEANGEWKMDAGQVKEVEMDGRKVFVYEDPNISPDDPDYFEDDGDFFGRKVIGRRVKLSPEDRVNVGKDGAIIEDLNLMDKLYREADRRFETLDIEEEAGRIKSYDEYETRARELTQADAAANARRFLELQTEGGQASAMPSSGGAISSGLFPSDPIETLNTLGDATGY